MRSFRLCLFLLISLSSLTLLSKNRKDPTPLVIKPSINKVSPMDLYVKTSAEDLAASKVIENSMEFKRSEICPTYREKDFSNCIKIYLQKNQMKSSAHIIGMSAVITRAALLDQKNGTSATVVNLMSLDNLLVLVEGIQLDQFHLSQIAVQSIPEKAELATIMASDETKLTQTLTKIYAQIEAGLKTSPQSRDIASVEEWKKKVISNLSTRLTRQKTKTLKYTRR